jgi:chromosome segregation ATPase
MAVEMDKGSYLRHQIDEVTAELVNSRSILTELKKNLTLEETKTIGLKLKKDKLEELLRKHNASLPSCQEKEHSEKEIDAEFLRKLPSLLEKI